MFKDQNRVFSDPETNLQEMTTRGEDVYFIVWQLGLAVTVNKAMRCTCHNLFWYFCLKMSVCPWKRGLNSEGTVQKQMDAVKSISSASKPCSSLVRRNAAYCQLNLRNSSCMRSTGGRGMLRTAYMTTLKARALCSSCACWRHFNFSNWGVQCYLCSPCEAFISPNSCRLKRSWPLLLVVRSCQSWQKARHHGNKTDGIHIGEIY